MQKAPQEAVVVFNGCFCPVHAGHVKALMDTKRKVEADGKITVVAGYFAVATDGYVSRKLDGALEAWMTAAARVDMCKAVATDVDFNISAVEFAGWKQCGKAMVAQYHSAETAVIGVRDEAKKGGVSRKGDGATAELSSTYIRSEFTRQGCTRQVIDKLVGQRLLGRAVGECWKQKLGCTPQTMDTPINQIPQGQSLEESLMQRLGCIAQVACICCDATGQLLGSQCPLCDGLAHFPEDPYGNECTPAAPLQMAKEAKGRERQSEDGRQREKKVKEDKGKRR